MEDRLKGLIDSLNEKTKNRKSKWERMGRSDQFTLTLDSGMISINKLITNNGNLLYQLAITNVNGDVIIKVNEVDKPRTLDEPNDFEILSDFHDNVSKAYFRVDETIENILDEIQKNVEIGKDLEDQLPF